jgi:cytochrome c biogenesis protein CcmG/thiol:disulfide interchange protein DsbE
MGAGRPREDRRRDGHGEERRMTLRQQWTAVVGVVAGLGAVAAVAYHLLGWEFRLVTIGSHAPTFRAATLDVPPRLRTIDDYRGQVVLLNVWATWCAPCRVEMPSIEALYHVYGPQGLHVVAVSVDDPGTDSTIRAFARRYGLTFDILHDSTGQIQRTYQTTGEPETFVIARDGVIRKKVIGADDWSTPGNQALIAQLLREPAP